MLLIIIVIQTSRKSKSAKKKSLLQHKRNETQICDETFKQPPNGQNKKYLKRTFSKQSNHFYQPVDPVYHEIDESMELMQIPASTDTVIELEDHNLSKCFNNSISNVIEHDDLNVQTSESYVISSRESMCPDTNNGGYLESTFVRANIEVESKWETHSYIDMKG